MTSSLLQDLYFQQQSQNLIDDGKSIAQLVLNSGGDLSREVDVLDKVIDSHVMIIDRSGLVMSCDRSMGMQRGMSLGTEEVNKVLNGDTVVRRGFHPYFQSEMLTVAVPVKSGGKVLGAVLLYKPVEGLKETAAAIRRIIASVAFGAVLLATVLGLFLSKRISSPLLHMNRVAREMASGNFGEKVNVNSADEVGTLGETINFLSRQLQQNLQELYREKERLKNILSSMGEGVLTLSGEGLVLQVNKQAVKLLGVELTAGQELAGTVELLGLKRIFCANSMAAKQQETELEINNKIIAVHPEPFIDDKGKTGVVAVLQDVTFERQAEKMRREFIAGVSHELRTPLSFIQGFTEALQDNIAESEAERAEYLAVIQDETGRLRRLVDDLLELNRLELGQLEMDLQPVDIAALCGKVVKKYQKLKADYDIRLEVEAPASIAEVSADPYRLEQILVNLLENALCHLRPQGQVKVTVRPQNEYVSIAVADNGSGIPREELPFIWEKFYKVDKARQRNSGGTGLGLAIVRQLVEAQGGSVAVESIEDQGSTFFITLPRKENNDKDQPQES